MLTLFTAFAFHDIEAGVDRLTQTLRAKFYHRGRVIFPAYVIKHLLNMIELEKIDMSAVENQMRSRCNPGHIWA